MRKCLARIKRLNLNLSEAEMIQIANTLPESDIELYLVIENVNERLSEEDQSNIKAIISEYTSSAMQE
jgi:DNA-directed RNA polymerase subunit F